MHEKTEKAILLKLTPFGESDNIAEFFGEESGRFSLLCKGVRKATSKNKGSLRILSILHVEYFENGRNTLQRLKRSTPIFPFWYEDFESLLFGSLISEMMMIFCKKNESHSPLFCLWEEFFISIRTHQKIVDQKIFLVWAYRSFFLWGLFPDFSYDQSLKTKISPNKSQYFWEKELGISEVKTSESKSVKSISFEILKICHFLSQNNFLEGHKVILSPQHQKKLWEIFWWFAEDHIEFMPRSKKMIESLETQK